MIGRRLLQLTLAGLFLTTGGGLIWWFTADPAPVAVALPEFTDDANRLPTNAEFAELARTDPVAMLRASLSRYAREVAGYRATLEKQERLKGTLHPPEVLRVSIREKPIGVSMRWVSGGRPDFLGVKTAGVLYAEGENDNEIATWRPEARFQALREKRLDPKGTFAGDASRYCITDAGFQRTMLRTLKAWEERQKAGELPFVYHGTRSVPQAGNRVCHVIERTCPRREADSFALDEAPPTDAKRIERDGFDAVTIFLDAENWIQVGTELKRKNGEPVGSYYFRDLELNPTFAADEFTPTMLKKAP